MGWAQSAVMVHQCVLALRKRGTPKAGSLTLTLTLTLALALTLTRTLTRCRGSTLRALRLFS